MAKTRIHVALLTALGLSAALIPPVTQPAEGKAWLVQTQAAPTPAPAPFGKYTETINGVTLELVRIPAGSFLMGNDRSPNPEEKPRTRSISGHSTWASTKLRASNGISWLRLCPKLIAT